MIARFILHRVRRHSCERPLLPGLKVRGGGRGRVGGGAWRADRARAVGGAGGASSSRRRLTKPSAEGVGGGGHGELGRD